VPCVPGYHDDAQDDKTLKEAAMAAGFPLMLKAVVGGGGKGMRIAHTAKDFDAQLKSARAESLNAFGDDRSVLCAWCMYGGLRACVCVCVFVRDQVVCGFAVMLCDMHLRLIWCHAVLTLDVVTRRHCIAIHQDVV
jgi:hypothetical protein